MEAAARVQPALKRAYQMAEAHGDGEVVTALLEVARVETAMLAALEALVDQSDRVACPICGGRGMACSDSCAVRAVLAALALARGEVK